MRIPLCAAALLSMTLAGTTWAHAEQDRASVGNDITIHEGETVADVACAFCSVRVHGEVKGDIAVLFGSVSIDEDKTVSGDVAILGGDLMLGEDARVGGDVAIAAGLANLDPSAGIGGTRSILSGGAWLLLPLAPVLILAGIIWLVVYLVQRNRYRLPVYPNGRGVPGRRNF